MNKRILVIQGHPDRNTTHFGHALADAYAQAARAAGHAVQVVHVADLDFPLLRSKADWEQGAVPPALRPAQQAIEWTEHLVLFFPLWLGGMPAMLKDSHMPHTPFEGRRNDLLCEGFNVVPTSEDIYNAGSRRFDGAPQPESWSAHQ